MEEFEKLVAESFQSELMPVGMRVEAADGDPGNGSEEASGAAGSENAEPVAQDSELKSSA